MLAVYKKELKQYFTSMIGFVFLAFFLVILGLYTWVINFANGSGDFSTTLNNVQFLFVVLMPILTMRVVAEENRQKTDQLLYTSPISITKVILGKYLAVLTLFAAGVVVITTYPFIILHYNSDVQLSMAFSAIIGFFLLGAAYIAIGMFISSMTESQVIAAVVSFIVMIVTFLMPNLTTMLPSDGKSQALIIAVVWIILAVISYGIMKNVVVSAGLAVAGEVILFAVYKIKSSLFDSLLSKILNGISVADRFSDFTLGIMEYAAVIYYLSIIFLFVFLTIQMIKRKRFN